YASAPAEPERARRVHRMSPACSARGSSRARASLLALGAVCALGTFASTSSGAVPAQPAQAAHSHASVRAEQPLAQLLTSHRVHRAPSASSAVVEDLAPSRPITGERTTLPVISRTTTRDGVAWLRVMLPGRPNSSSGWIAAQGTRASATGWRLAVSLRARRVTVFRHGRVVRRFSAVVGKPSTPTPTGRFFVEETLAMSVGEPGGPFALALSARSDALQEFEGGPGQIALHGRDNLGGVLGAAESHGCMRLATASIDWLAERIGPGVPVTIE
ncbi:MAG TPA: L,D-transpeptidase, partial [Solirubrobacteraceae bacterium]|nr:L,D-transpeptidase [Solirubrobacteraceae bacterium]